MSWELNKLEKITEIEYIPGTPAIPGSEGTAGSPSYTYWENTQVGGGTYTNGPPSGWDTELVIPIPGGGTQTLRTGGYRYFNGEKAYLSAISFGTYIYVAPSQTISTLVTVPAVAPVAAVPGVPGTPAETIRHYNLGWNSGAVGPATLAVNKVFTWRMSAGNVGSVVGLTLSTAPQDNSHTGMALSIMAQSGRYQIYRGSVPVGSSVAFTSGTKFALSRTNTGNIEVYASGGLIHTEALPDDVVVDSSLYSGGDVIWDAVELAVALAPLNSNIAASTASSAQAVAGAVAVTKIFGPGTALGVASATTSSAAINGSVLVNGSVLTSGGATTVTAAVGVAESIGAVPTFGTGTALGTLGSTTASDAVAAGDPSTGVGISTNTSISGDMAMLPITAAGASAGVYTGWTGNYEGDALKMLPMTSASSGDLAAPVIGIGQCIMAPMSAGATGATGSISTSSLGNMLPMSMFASSETEYSQAQGYMHPLTGLGNGELGEIIDPSLTVEITEEFYAATATPTSNYVSQFLEQLTVSESTQTFIQMATEVAEAVAAMTTARADYVLQVAEAFNITENLTVTQIVRIAEALMAADATQTFYTAVVTVLSAMGMSDNYISGGSAEGGTAGVGVQDFGPPSVEFTFTGYWRAGTVVELGYTTDVGPGFISYTYEYAQMGPDAMALFAVALDAQPLVNATFDGTSVTMTAQAPATTVQL